MTLAYGDLKKGMPIELDGEPYTVVDYERSKMQQRAPVMRIRFKAIRTGQVVDRTFQGYDVNFKPASVDRRSAQYIYKDGDLYYFMDSESFEQFPLSEAQIADALDYIVDQASVDMVLFQGAPIAIELPVTVDLKVTEADPGYKGNTAQGATKPAKLETGLGIQVPLFVDVGDTVKVDTRSGEYLSRA